MAENENREVGFPDGQFMANGVDEVNSQHLAACWRNGDHEQAAIVISYLPESVKEVAERIYDRCKGIEPRGDV